MKDQKFYVILLSKVIIIRFSFRKKDMQASSILADRGQLQQYFIIKRTVTLPPKLNILFSILQKAIENPQECEQNGKLSSRAFLYAFTKMAIDEQARFMDSCIKYTVKCLMKKEKEEVDLDGGAGKSQIRNIETTVQVYSTYLKVPLWTDHDFKFDKNKKTVVLGSKKKTQIIDLHNFLVRRSKKHKGCIVLEGVNPAKQTEHKKYVLFFKPGLSQQIYQQLFQAIIGAKQVQIADLIKSNQQEMKISYSGESNNMVFLSSKNINEFLNYKESIMKYLVAGKFDFKQISLDRKEFKIQQSQKNEKIFKLEGTLQVQAKDVKQQLLTNFGSPKNKVVISCQILQSYSGKYMAVYEKYLFTNKIQQLITIRQQNLSENDQVLFVKGMDNIMVKNFLQFLSVKIKPVKDKESKIIVVCSIVLDNLITVDKIKLFLFTLYQNCIPKIGQKLMQSNPLNAIKEEETFKEKERQEEVGVEAVRDQFHTVMGYGATEEQYMQFVEGEAEGQESKNNKQPREMNQQKIQQSLNSNYLSHKFKTIPIDGYKIMENLMTQHYLFTDWSRRKEGGVLCKNQQLVNNQKRMFKDLISRIGSNFMKTGGSSVLNMSLPVIVFKKESHLYSIAKDLCYAPLLFENLTDKLQRVKKGVILALSVGTLGISIQKPFNPQLGQTYQGWIGGCPVYLQQISHHPPIGSYYFIGRGYKIYGQISPKISFGMNNVKGYSELPNYLIFDDGTQLEMIYGKMIIHGLLFGQRQFNYQDRIYVYDRRNQIFAEVNYGPRKKGMLGKSSQPWDFCYGAIYQVRPQFQQAFKLNSKKFYPTKQYIVKQLSNFEGIWNEAINFDGVEYINFKTQLPCQVIQQQHPLPSNSNYRKDLLKLIEGDLEEAQQQKQIMQEIQRRDRKLREQYDNKAIMSAQEKRQKIKKSITR